MVFISFIDFAKGISDISVHSINITAIKCNYLYIILDNFKCFEGLL